MLNLPPTVNARTYPASAITNSKRIIGLSVVIVRACARSSNHRIGIGTAVPQSTLRGLLDAPIETGHDNRRDPRLRLRPDMRYSFTAAGATKRSRIFCTS